MATATAKLAKKGFRVRCPLCAAEGSIKLDAADVRGFECTECSELFGPEDVRRFIAEWESLLAWIESAPEL